jgi:hypothetical protein
MTEVVEVGERLTASPQKSLRKLEHQTGMPRVAVSKQRRHRNIVFQNPAAPANDFIHYIYRIYIYIDYIYIQFTMQLISHWLKHHLVHAFV